MATEQFSDNLVIALVIPVGKSAQIVIQVLYDSFTWILSDCSSYSRVIPNSVGTNVRLSQLSIHGITVSGFIFMASVN